MQNGEKTTRVNKYIITIISAYIYLYSNMSWEKEIKGKRWIMRHACEEEQIWIFEMIKKYQASTCKWKVIEWSHNYGMSGIEFHKTGFAFNIKAEGLLTWDNKPIDSITDVSFYVSRWKLYKWMKENGIRIPKFGAAEYVYRDDGKLLK